MLEKPAAFRGIPMPVLDRALDLLRSGNGDKRRLRDILRCIGAERDGALSSARAIDESRSTGDRHEKELISLYTMAIRQCETLLSEALDR